MVPRHGSIVDGHYFCIQANFFYKCGFVLPPRPRSKREGSLFLHQGKTFYKCKFHILSATESERRDVLNFLNADVAPTHLNTLNYFSSFFMFSPTPNPYFLPFFIFSCLLLPSSLYFLTFSHRAPLGLNYYCTNVTLLTRYDLFALILLLFKMSRWTFL